MECFARAATELPEYECGRAESGERGLDEVHTHESSEDQPPRRNEIGECNGQEDDKSGKCHDRFIDIHFMISTIAEQEKAYN
jgi:hypothetical protein